MSIWSWCHVQFGTTEAEFLRLNSRKLCWLLIRAAERGVQWDGRFARVVWWLLQPHLKKDSEPPALHQLWPSLAPFVADAEEAEDVDPFESFAAARGVLGGGLGY